MARTGPNLPCPCGSGLKHKKCCMGKGTTSLRKPTPSDRKYDSALAHTVTGEVTQLVRLYYRVPDRRVMARALEDLRCVSIDPPRRRWVWLYQAEAKRIHFSRSYSALPKDVHSLVIGTWRLGSEGEMCLDLRSIERANAAIPFFDKHIDSSVAEITDAAVVNRVFASCDLKGTDADFESAFSQDSITVLDPEDLLREMQPLETTNEPMKRIQTAFEFLGRVTERPFPSCERFPVHYYEDGLAGFSLALRVRQRVAIEHWMGNESFTAGDVVNEVCASIPDGDGPLRTPL